MNFAPASGDAGFSSSETGAVGRAELPEAPLPVPAPMFGGAQSSSTGGVTPRLSIDVPSGWTAQPLTAGDKVLMGFRNIVSPVGFAGTLISAGYSQLVNGEPNYGTDRGAFGQRLGAGVLRSASEDIFNISILSPILHQDPRYYVQGPQTSFVHRVLYAATRPLIGRTDGGHSTVNASLLIGYAGAAALTPTYYPQINHNFNDVAATFGSALGGAAIGDAVTEFSDQLLKAIHLKH